MILMLWLNDDSEDDANDDEKGEAEEIINTNENLVQL